MKEKQEERGKLPRLNQEDQLEKPQCDYCFKELDFTHKIGSSILCRDCAEKLELGDLVFDGNGKIVRFDGLSIALQNKENHRNLMYLIGKLDGIDSRIFGDNDEDEEEDEENEEEVEDEEDE